METHERSKNKQWRCEKKLFKGAARRRALLKKLVRKAAPDYKMNLTDPELKFIKENTKTMPFQLRVNLLNYCPHYYYSHTTIRDCGGLFKAIIYLDDKTTNRGKNKPIAYIEFRDNSIGYSYVEFIDIIASVKKDAALIGHPVIVFAIKHWQEIIKWQNFHRQSGQILSKELEKLLDQKNIKIEDGKKYANNIVDFNKNKLAFKEAISTKDISPELAHYIERVFEPLSKKANELTDEWIKENRKNKKTLSDDEKRIYCEKKRSELTKNALVEIYVFRRHLDQQADLQTDRKKDKEKLLKQPTDEMIAQAEQYAEENYTQINWKAGFKAQDDENAEKFIKSAKQNLKALGNALLSGTENRAIKPQKAFALQIENFEIEKQETYLDYACKVLKHLKPTHDFKQRIEFIGVFLERIQSNFPRLLTEKQKKEIAKKENRKFEDIENDFLTLSKEIDASYIGTTPISVETIIEFLNSPVGKSFVYLENKEPSSPDKNEFQNRFEEWFLNKTTTTRKKYKKDAKSQSKNETPEQTKPYSFPTYRLPHREVFQILFDVLSAELVRAEEPQIMPTNEVPLDKEKLNRQKETQQQWLIESGEILQKQEKELDKHLRSNPLPDSGIGGESDFSFPTPR